MQDEGGSGGVGVGHVCGRQGADELESQSQPGFLGWTADSDAGIGDCDGDVVGVVADREVDVADTVWVGVADGVCEGFAHGQRDRGEKLAVIDADLGKYADGGVPGLGQRCCGRGPSPAEDRGRHQGGYTLLLGLVAFATPVDWLAATNTGQSAHGPAVAQGVRDSRWRWRVRPCDDECGRVRTMFIAYWVVITFGLTGAIVVGLTGH